MMILSKNFKSAGMAEVTQYFFIIQTVVNKGTVDFIVKNA